MSFLSRLYNITKSYAPQKKRNWMNFFYQQDDASSFENQESESFQNKRADFQNSHAADIPQQVVKDLAEFELSPPSSLDEVKKRWKAEMKKYHSDKYINDPEKLKVSKEIMQIYNGAYERLKQYYQSNQK